MLYEFIKRRCIYCEYITIVTREKGICKNKGSKNYNLNVDLQESICDDYNVFKLADISINGELVFMDDTPIPTWKKNTPRF